MKAESRVGSPPSVIPVKKRKKSKEEKKSLPHFLLVCNQPSRVQNYAMAPDKKDNKRKGKPALINKCMVFY